MGPFPHLHVASAYSLRYGSAFPRRWSRGRPNTAWTPSR